MGYDDQINFHKQTSLLNGNPGVRWIDVPRYGSGEERVSTFYEKVAEALTAPLTADEQQTGLYQPPSPPRVLFEGTLDEAYEFYQQTTLIENCRNCPISKYTDGLPVVVPTEEKVAEMLTGTSHDPNEEIKSQVDVAGFGGVTPAGTTVLYGRCYTATVEKVATCAVMAGCKPEYLPVVLAIAACGGTNTSCPGTSGAEGVGTFIISGPVAKEIGMNAGQNALDVGNQANMTLGRVGAIISVNLAGCITGLIRTDSGNPIHSLCFPEDAEGLPPGWEGYNEESTYSKDGETVSYTTNESVLGRAGLNWSMVELQHSPGSTRQLNSGLGGFARNIQYQLDIPYGTPGNYNWLMGFLPTVKYFQKNPTGVVLVMNPYMALMLYDHGFKTKADAYQWICDTYTITAGEWSRMGWWDFMTDAGTRIEPTSGLPYNDLPEDYPIRAFGTNPMANCFIVSSGFADELCYMFGGGRGRPTAYPIDPWR
jgi:hypothetical protein